MAGAVAFPALVPITPHHDAVAENVAAWAVLELWDKPFLTLWCPNDPVLGHLTQMFIERIPGATGQPHRRFEPCGHFVPSLANVIEALLPQALHNTVKYANNRVECDHGRLKARLRPMRGLKTDRTASVIITGHAFIQNPRRGDHELDVDARTDRLRCAAAFDELTPMI